MQWPTELTDPSYAPLVLGAVAEGRFEHAFVPLVVDAGGHRGVFAVSQDALKIDGVRVDVSATLQQHVADLLGAYLITPKLFDQMWANRAVTLLPCTQPITSSAAGMVGHSACVDKRLAAAGGTPPNGIVQTVGKTWVLSNRLTNRVACNMGWHLEQPIAGIPFDPAPTVPGAHMIQSPGYHHDSQWIDYCLAPGTRVLTADLRWVPIESVAVGDELIGFEEEMPTVTCLRRATVRRTTRIVRNCYEVRTSKATVIASDEHRWPVYNSLVRKYFYEAGARGGTTSDGRWPAKFRRIGWVATKDLKSGSLIPYLCKPWDQDTSWDGAWMAGLLDGEGWLSGTSFGFGQMPGPILERAIEIVRRNGMDVSTCANAQGCVRVRVPGPRGSLRAIGTFRPLRLMLKSASAWDGRRAFGGGCKTVDVSAEVLGVKPIGRHEVVGLETSTGTFIAEGLLSHNSQVALFVKRECTVDGQSTTFADVAGNPALAALVSHEGVLRVLRQPGAPELVRPPTTASKPVGGATVALMASGAGFGASVAGPAGGLVGALVGWAADAIRRRLLA